MRYQFIDEANNQQESTLGTLGRGLARTGARVGEAVAGLPGDVVSGALGLGNLGSRILTGSEIPGVSTAQEYLPTSQKIREKVTEPLTGEYLKPRGGFEETLDTLVGDVASLLTPVGIASKGAALTGRALGKTALKAAGAGLVGKGVGEFFGPEAGAIAKGVTLGLGSTAFGRKALTKQMNTDYGAADFAIPHKARLKDISLRTKIGHDIKVISKGVSPNKDSMLNVLEGVKKNFAKDGTIGVKDVWSLKRNVNEWLRDPQIERSVKNQLAKTVGDLNQSLGKYAQTNSEFSVPFYRAEELYKGLNDASQLSQFLQKNATVQKALQHWAPLSFAGTVLTRGLGVPVGTALKGLGVSGAAAIGAREAVKFGELFAKNPTARKFYIHAVKASAIGDAAAAAKNLKAFDQAAATFEQQSGTQEQGRYEFLSE